MESALCRIPSCFFLPFFSGRPFSLVLAKSRSALGFIFAISADGVPGFAFISPFWMARAIPAVLRCLRLTPGIALLLDAAVDHALVFAGLDRAFVVRRAVAAAALAAALVRDHRALLAHQVVVVGGADHRSDALAEIVHLAAEQHFHAVRRERHAISVRLVLLRIGRGIEFVFTQKG